MPFSAVHQAILIFHVTIPAKTRVLTLLPRKKAQMETIKQFKVFYQFHFTDKLKESGITFVYHAVDDITKHMKMGHYDHGSAVAARM